MAITAKDLIASTKAFNVEKIDKQNQEYCFNLLKQLLNNHELRHNIIHDMGLKNSGLPKRLTIPEWAYLAVDILEEHSKIPTPSVRHFFIDACYKMLDEYDTEEKIFTNYFIQEDIPVIKVIANSLNKKCKQQIYKA